MSITTKEILHVKCHNCKCYRLPNDFLNNRNRKMKTCAKCRAFNKIHNKKNRDKKRKGLELNIDTDISNDNNPEIINVDSPRTDIETTDDSINHRRDIIKNNLERELELYKQLLILKDKIIEDYKRKEKDQNRL